MTDSNTMFLFVVNQSTNEDAEYSNEKTSGVYVFWSGLSVLPNG